MRQRTQQVSRSGQWADGNPAQSLVRKLGKRPLFDPLMPVMDGLRTAFPRGTTFRDKRFGQTQKAFASDICVEKQAIHLVQVQQYRAFEVLHRMIDIAVAPAPAQAETAQ